PARLSLKEHAFGKGKGLYMSGFALSNANTSLLLNLIMSVVGDSEAYYITDNVNTECTYYPESRLAVIVNNSDEEQSCSINTPSGPVKVSVKPWDITEITL
ncbi:MAG: D-galactosyl-beta-1-4-L-rhamnose phosphorylase, partial [Lachnospiraceae bacterium]|nr:D-galactosyl-beta-1-4-L-rhamnose phosphorylase [Lachnospiraceae bacterium]